MPVTIKDLAREAGVSVGTVSNVLNCHEGVSPQKRDLVLAAMKKLGYNPNFAARALKTGRTGNIGLIIPDIGNPFYPEFARATEDAAKSAGFNLFLCNSDRNVRKEQSYITSLLDRMVDGIIIYKPLLPAAELQSQLGAISTVLIDVKQEEYPGFSILNADDYGGITTALEYLWGLGHRHIAFIAGLLDSYSSARRLQAYEDFLALKQQPVLPGHLQYGRYDWHSGYECTVSLLRQAIVPTAILAANDLMAMGAIKAVQARGLSIPNDISIMGNDDIMPAGLSTPALTTIRVPCYEMGLKSVQILLSKLNNEAAQEINQPAEQFKHEIIYRDSVTGKTEGELLL